MIEKNTIRKESYQEDEINLLDLWNTLVDGKRWIISSVILTLILASAYLILVDKEYEATVYMLPPTFKDVEILNTVENFNSNPSFNLNFDFNPNFDFNENDVVTPQDVYSMFLTNLQSRKIRNTFFAKKIIKGVKVDLGKKKTKLYEAALTRLSLMLSKKENIAKWANDYVKMSIRQTKSILLGDAESKITSAKEHLKRQISTLKKSALIKRKDRIERLKESLLIASSLGIISPMNTSVEMNTFEKSENPETPKIYQGIAALQKEIDVLKARKNDDAFIPELRDLENKLSLYQSINFDREKLQVVTIDEWAHEPIKPVKPKKVLVLALSIILGLMFGVFLVFIRKIFNKKMS